MNKQQFEQQAEASVLAPLGDYVGSIGLDVPMAHYSKAQIEAMVALIIASYQNELCRLTQDEIPF